MHIQLTASMIFTWHHDHFMFWNRWYWCLLPGTVDARRSSKVVVEGADTVSYCEEMKGDSSRFTCMLEVHPSCVQERMHQHETTNLVKLNKLEFSCLGEHVLVYNQHSHWKRRVGRTIPVGLASWAVSSGVSHFFKATTSRIIGLCLQSPCNDRPTGGVSIPLPPCLCRSSPDHNSVRLVRPIKMMLIIHPLEFSLRQRNDNASYNYTWFAVKVAGIWPYFYLLSKSRIRILPKMARLHTSSWRIGFLKLDWSLMINWQFRCIAPFRCPDTWSRGGRPGSRRLGVICRHIIQRKSPIERCSKPLLPFILVVD